MDPARIREIEADCLRMVIGFFDALDNRETDRLLDHFTEDGVWTRRGQALNGRAAIAEALAGRSPDMLISHLVANPVVRIEDDRNATVSSTVTIYRADSTPDSGPAEIAGPTAVMIFTDRLTATPDGWKIVEKKSRPRFRIAGAR